MCMSGCVIPPVSSSLLFDEVTGGQNKLLVKKMTGGARSHTHTRKLSFYVDQKKPEETLDIKREKDDGVGDS